jgi:TonB family protein
MEEEKVREPKVSSSVKDGELHLLLEDVYEDDVSSYRRREAAWISGAVHAVIILLLILAPKWVGTSAHVVPMMQQRQQTTYLELPPDQLKLKTPPKTDRLSDANRIAQTRTPVPSKEALKKLLDARDPGKPKTPPPAPAQQQAQVTPQQQPATQQAAAQPPEPPPPTQTAKLDAPVPPKAKIPFPVNSPGSTISHAIDNVATSHGTSSVPLGGGNYGSGIRPRVDTRGNLEILSDTMGVDFGPYMRRLRQAVQEHWDPLIPQSAMPPEMKRGTVIIEFAILKDGRVAGLRVVNGSGDTALDRAAYGAITYAIPLPQLPANFSGDYLLLRAHFLYNPDKNDLE